MTTRKRGRPMKYNNAEELQTAVDAYFASCRGQYRRDDNGAYILDRHGRPIIDGAKPLTLTGLQMALGFKSRQSLHDYRGRRAFREIVERARLQVENYAEMRLYDKDGYSGAAWVLSTVFGWKQDSATDKKALPIVRIITDSNLTT